MREIGGAVRAFRFLVMPVVLATAVVGPSPVDARAPGAVAGHAAVAPTSLMGSAATARLPRNVSKARFVRLMGAASRATEQGLREGAVFRRTRHIRFAVPIPDVRFTGRGRTKAGAARLALPGDPWLLARRTSGELFAPLSSWRRVHDVDPDELADALFRLGRPKATWVRSRAWEARLLDEPSRALLVALPRRAEQWSWRASGRTVEWTITGTRPRPFTVTLVLDGSSRIVRLIDVRRGPTSLAVRWERTAWSIRYDPSIASIELPAPAEWVPRRALMKALGMGNIPVPT